MASPAISPALTSLPIIAFSLILLLLHSSASAAAAATPPASQECVTELVMFSPCLSFVSAPPNNLSDTADPDCCAAFSDTLSDVGGGGGSCLCYLLREPRMLGFPINQTRLIALPSACGLGQYSFEDLCAEAMPPDQDEADSTISSPPDSAPSIPQSPSASLPPESDNSDNTPPSSTTGSTGTGSAPSPSPANVPMMLTLPPRLPEILSSAPTVQFYSRDCWYLMGTLTLSCLFI